MNGMHSAFPGLLPGNVFAPRPPAAASATSETVRAWASELADIAAAHSGELAAVVVEPDLQGAGGMHAYPAECLAVLRQVADRHGLLLIFDEIATGFGRTGELLAAGHGGVVPDVMCVGRALTGGYLTLARCSARLTWRRRVSGGQAGGQPPGMRRSQRKPRHYRRWRLAGRCCPDRCGPGSGARPALDLEAVRAAGMTAAVAGVHERVAARSVGAA